MNIKIDNSKKSIFRIILTIAKFAILIAIIVGLPLYIYFCHHEIIEMFSNFDNIEAFAMSHKGDKALPFIYIACQIIQIIISVIPGQELQIAAGFMYGTFFAFLLSLVGAIIGTFITYHLGRFLGKDMMYLLFGEEKVATYIEKLQSKKAVMLVFLIYLIPGLPKDVVSYIAGLANMKLPMFLIVSNVGRCPGMLASIIIGEALINKNFVLIIIVAVVVSIAFILGIIFRKKLLEKFDVAYEKMMGADKEKSKDINGE